MADPESLDLCGYYHRYQNGEKGTEQKSKNLRKMSHVLCHVLRVTLHLSPTPTATATDPPPENTPLCTEDWFANILAPKKII